MLTTLLLVPTALAQQSTDPTVNDSDFQTDPPPADEAYLNESESNQSASSSSTSDPTVTDADFDTSAPPADASYLDEAARAYGVDESAGSGAAATSAPARAPGLGVVAIVAGVLVVALVLRHGRRSG